MDHVKSRGIRRIVNKLKYFNFLYLVEIISNFMLNIVLH